MCGQQLIKIFVSKILSLSPSSEFQLRIQNFGISYLEILSRQRTLADQTHPLQKNRRAGWIICKIPANSSCFPPSSPHLCLSAFLQENTGWEGWEIWLQSKRKLELVGHCRQITWMFPVWSAHSHGHVWISNDLMVWPEQWPLTPATFSTGLSFGFFFSQTRILTSFDFPAAIKAYQGISRHIKGYQEISLKVSQGFLASLNP